MAIGDEYPEVDRPECSVVLPAFEEGAGLRGVAAELKAALDRAVASYEIIFVDDGSRDHTWAVIQELSAADGRVRGIRFSRNFGHQLAIHAGVKAATGDVVVVMDSDGQDPPEIIPRLIELIRQGNDVVNCVRTKRKENALMRASYFLFYRVYSALVPFEIPLDSGDFCAMNRRTADLVSGVSQHTPFIRGIRSWAGGKQVNIEYERRRRQLGRSKYSLWRLFMLALSAITAFSKAPLRISIIAGLAISGGSLLYAVVVVFLKLTIDYPPGQTGWPSLATLIAILGGAQLTVLGIIGEYLGHVFDSVRGMPAFQVQEEIGFDRGARTSPATKVDAHGRSAHAAL